MADLPIHTALNVPTVVSHPSIHCLQWSGDGQVCFVTKSAVHILGGREAAGVVSHDDRVQQGGRVGEAPELARDIARCAARVAPPPPPPPPLTLASGRLGRGLLGIAGHLRAERGVLAEWANTRWKVCGF
ncbi:hypothetical protein HWV62_19649 [Athelia sp. TMB]|nr:hypothetical protein HWV62_19649 [Athelia sp. TMB]